MKTKIIAVVGPTASGKTSLGVEIARAVGGEIISADSMQIYKGMSIATAAPSKEEMQGVPHHLVEFLDSSELFSVADFTRLAKEKIAEINSRGNVPVIVGGTGLFIDNLVKNTQFTEAQTDFALRESLMKKSEDELYSELCKIDYEASLKIHKNNKIRVVRALELYYSTGTTKSEQDELSHITESPYDALYIGIAFKDRQRLYDRINKRAELMFENGLEQEARSAYQTAGTTASQAIGHKELIKYFNGEETLEEAKERLKRETRRYAKRQITWFKRNQSINWLYADEISKEELASKAINISKSFLKEERL